MRRMVISSRSDINNLMVGLGICQFDRQYDIISHIAYSNLSQEQFDTLAKCTKFGWKYSKIVWDDDLATMLITAEKTFAWVLPSGILKRVKLKDKKVPPKNWKQN